MSLGAIFAFLFILLVLDIISARSMFILGYSKTLVFINLLNKMEANIQINDDTDINIITYN